MPESITFEHLKGLPSSDQALILLKRVASRVWPIMQKHDWLPVLAEYFPNDPHLKGSNINMGQKILLRLRPAMAPKTFYPEEDIIHTLLHELAHNIHGSHDQNFQNFLSRLKEQYYELKRSGYVGEGFFSKGHQLGGIALGGPANSLTPRELAVRAAEKRAAHEKTLAHQALS